MSKLEDEVRRLKRRFGILYYSIASILFIIWLGICVYFNHIFIPQGSFEEYLFSLIVVPPFAVLLSLLVLNILESIFDC